MTAIFLRSARLIAPLMFLGVCHCGTARPVARGAIVGAPTGQVMEGKDDTAFRELMAAASAPFERLALSAKMVSFGADGRARATLQLVLQRPNQFRITVLGPHGPPLYAAACDGAELTSLDVANHHFQTQPASPQGIAHHLGGLDVGLSAEDWLQLLLGELAVPADAIGYKGDAPKMQNLVEWHWSASGRALAARFDSTSAQLIEANITLADGRLGLVTIKSRDSNKLPTQLALHVSPSADGRQSAQDVELTLFGMQELKEPLAADTFVLANPVDVPSM